MNKKIVFFCIFFAAAMPLLIMAVIMSFESGLVRFNYPSKKDYPIHGIDVSRHQKKIEWSLVPRDKIHFVYIKATEGGDWRDPLFLQNWNGARAAGFEVGAYHFFTLCRDGMTQASNFINYVPKEKDAMPPVVDLEFGGNCSRRPSKEVLFKDLDNFIDTLRTRYEKEPVLYITEEFYERYLKDTRFDKHPLWVRNIFFEPSREEYPSMVLWQYSNRGRLKGITGPVDLNVRIPADIQ